MTALMVTSNSKDRKKVLLGIIAGAHGIRGEVTLRSFTGAPGDIAAYGPLTDKAGARQFKIRVARVTPKGVIARIQGVEDRNAAEALKGTELYVERARLPKTKEAEFYHADLVGLEARDAGGARIGAIVNVANFGAGDLLELRRDDVKETEFIPFTNANVPEVDVAAGFAVIVPPQMTGEPEPASEDEAGEEDT